jgi:carboxypeptidase C (cathepsin A)
MAEKKEKDENQHAEKETTPEPPQDKLVETKHSIMLNGQKIPYTATCGTIVLKEEAHKNNKTDEEFEGEKPRATIFFIAYTRDDVENPDKRPLTFSFNGGPGSASVWLHLGVLGPRRVDMGDAEKLVPPPYRLRDNEFSLLDETDLVFIDPVSTGYSRPVSGEKSKQFHNLKKDIESVGDFIRLYTTRYKRWMSPKFLIGESYGTTRAAGLSGYLQDRHTMFLNGIMLVSMVLNFQTVDFEPGNELPYLLFLPTYTATAWYHKRLPEDLQKRNLSEVLNEVESFALNEYSLALLQGDRLEVKTRRQIARRLSRYTGLSPEYIERVNLRIEIFRFTKELLRDQHRTVGRLDSRFKGIDPDLAAEKFAHDPSMSAILGPYSAVFNQYVRAELNFESDLPYEVLKELYETWSYAEHENRYVDVGETLRMAICTNPYLKVFIACGYYDLATPYFATQYTINHFTLEPDLRQNLSMSHYEAGHMMYVHMPSLEKLKKDLAEFIHRSA